MTWGGVAQGLSNFGREKNSNWVTRFCPVQEHAIVRPESFPFQRASVPYG